MLAPYPDEQIDIVVGMESRGFIFSAPMAYQLDAGLVPVRKLGKLPAETITVEYALEYGSNTLEIHRDAIEPGQKVLIVDDLLATGGTVKGTIELVERLKGEVVGLGVPRRARVPQGPRPARRTPRHQRHQVLTGRRIEAGTIGRLPQRSQRRVAAAPGGGRTRSGPPVTPAATTPAATPPAAARRRSTSAGAGSSAVRRRADQHRGDGRRRRAGPPAGLGRGRRRDPRPGRRRGRARRRGDDPGAAPSATAGPTGFRTPFREDGGVLYLIDQRRLPDALVEYPCRSAGEVAFAIREMVVRGAPAIGQVAAIGHGAAAPSTQRDGGRTRAGRPCAASANALINARPTAVNLRWAVERMMARYDEVGDLSEDGDAIADAMREPRPTRSSSRRRPTTAGWPTFGLDDPARCPTTGRSAS